MAAPILTLDLYVHARGERAVRLSRDGDLRNAVWVALVHLDVAMAGDKRAIVTIPRWLRAAGREPQSADHGEPSDRRLWRLQHQACRHGRGL